MSKQIAIMAGNPRVEWKRVGDNERGKLVIESQIEAFKEAMKIVEETQHKVAKVTVLFDHRGKFRDQFLDEKQKLSKRQKQSLKLSYLHPDIRAKYVGEAKIPLEEISVISEDICRTFVKDKGDKGQMSMEAQYRCYSKGNSCDCDAEGCDIDLEKQYDEKINCTGIYAGAMYHLAKGCDENARLVTCAEYVPRRVMPGKTMQGSAMAYEVFGLKNDIEQRFIATGNTGKLYKKVVQFSAEKGDNSKVANISITPIK